MYFMYDNSKRLVRVVAPSFGQASSVANSVASGLEDSDRFELMYIELKYVVSSF